MLLAEWEVPGLTTLFRGSRKCLGEVTALSVQENPSVPSSRGVSFRKTCFPTQLHSIFAKAPAWKPLPECCWRGARYLCCSSVHSTRSWRAPIHARCCTPDLQKELSAEHIAGPAHDKQYACKAWNWEEEAWKTKAAIVANGHLSQPEIIKPCSMTACFPLPTPTVTILSSAQK